jgi:trimeric autotransporter adhesin
VQLTRKWGGVFVGLVGPEVNQGDDMNRMLRLSAVAILSTIAMACGGGGGALSSNAELASLTVSSGVLNPAFAPGTTSYTAMFIGETTVTVTPTAADAEAAITINGTALASGEASGSITLEPGPNPITVEVTAADGVTVRTYAVTANRLAQEAYLKASNAGTDDAFGISVALSGDTLAVGAPHEDSNAAGVGGNQTNDLAIDSGAVYVFTRTGTVWSQQAYLKASNTGAGDRFGISVALSGDTLAVGAPYEDSNAVGVSGNQTNDLAIDSGAVYVFTRTGTVWSQQAYIKASNTGAGDEFGRSVALSGDILAVGANLEDSGAVGVGGNQNDTRNQATDSGAVYVFTRTGTAWSQQDYIKASNTGAGDQFGRSVALSGGTLAVGAYGEASNAMGVGGDQINDLAANSGAVYVFTRDRTHWSQEAYIKASNTGANDTFGYSVALSGDTLAVGAIYEGSNAVGVGGDQTNDLAADSGAVYVFTRTGTVWSQQAYLKASNTGAGDQFGRSVALSGDTLAVGAHREDSDTVGVGGNQTNDLAADSGAVYVFTRTGTVWSQQAYLKASNAGANDIFGHSVALSGDTLAVGAFGEASNAVGVGGNQTNDLAPGSGAVYVAR